MRRINEFFFPIEADEDLSLHDGIWFYGLLGGSVLLTAFVVLVTL